jgi:hypothetical protein
MDRFRMATYNIHKGRGLDGRVSIERIGRVLAEVDADLVALQEVVSHEGLSIRIIKPAISRIVSDTFPLLEKLASIAEESTAM